MDTKLIGDFLEGLHKNNSLEWMRSNKSSYEKAKTEFEKVLQALINGISSYDTSIQHLIPKELLFRLNRDTRFSNDKSPYNPAFRAHISKSGKLPIPVGYYVHIKPANIFLGAGLFAPLFTDATKSIRDYIVENESEFLEIIEATNFKNNFVIDGEKLKNVPQGYDTEHKLAEYLKYKSWYIEYQVSDTVFIDADAFVKLSVEMFRYMKPLNDFLNRALVHFKMPIRK